MKRVYCYVCQAETIIKMALRAQMSVSSLHSQQTEKELMGSPIQSLEDPNSAAMFHTCSGGLHSTQGQTQGSFALTESTLSLSTPKEVEPGRIRYIYGTAADTAQKTKIQ